MDTELWSVFKSKFIHILEDSDINEYYKKVYKFLQNYENNVLLYGAPGFPTDLFIDEVLKAKFDLSVLHKTMCTWSGRSVTGNAGGNAANSANATTSSTANAASAKHIEYLHNPHFLEINMMHPNIEKNNSDLTKFFTDIIKNRNILSGHKHFIIIKHIDLLDPVHFTNYRIILERFSQNAYFLCTAHNIAKIDTPIKSRFSLMRIPLFTIPEIQHIFSKYLGMSVTANQRNIMKILFFGGHPCHLNFPPIADLFQNKKGDLKLGDIRQMSFKCFQYDVTIPELLSDILKLLPKNTTKMRRMKVIATAAELEHKIHLTKKSREPIYIEAFLCSVLV